MSEGQKLQAAVRQLKERGRTALDVKLELIDRVNSITELYDAIEHEFGDDLQGLSSPSGTPGGAVASQAAYLSALNAHQSTMSSSRLRSSFLSSPSSSSRPEDILGASLSASSLSSPSASGPRGLSSASSSASASAGIPLNRSAPKVVPPQPSRTLDGAALQFSMSRPDLIRVLNDNREALEKQAIEQKRQLDNTDLLAAITHAHRSIDPTVVNEALKSIETKVYYYMRFLLPPLSIKEILMTVDRVESAANIDSVWSQIMQRKDDPDVQLYKSRFHLQQYFLNRIRRDSIPSSSLASQAAASVMNAPTSASYGIHYIPDN